MGLMSKHVENCELVADRAALLQKLPRRGRIAELGVDQGDFSARIMAQCEPEKLTLVDLWGTRRYGEKKAQGVQEKFEDHLSSGRMEIVRASSIAAAAGFEDETFDWVYIDTDHSYKTTKEELLHWAPKVKKTGYLAGHDHVMGNWKKRYKYGVIEAVQEFCIAHNWRYSFLTADYSENNSFAISRIPD